MIEGIGERVARGEEEIPSLHFVVFSLSGLTFGGCYSLKYDTTKLEERREL